MNELNTALYSRLQGTSAVTSLLAGTTSIYHLRAPNNAGYPYIVFSIQGGGDENDTANRTKNLVLFIRAYSGVSAKQAGSVDAQIDAALHLTPLTVSGWTDFWLAREEDLEAVESEPDGQSIYMRGGFYRVRLDKE